MTTKRKFPDWIAAYVDLFDPITESPTKIHFWTAVSTIAGALTRHVWIDEVLFRYYPNFCIIFVAPPGIIAKSTSMGHGISILRELSHTNFAADETTFPAFMRSLAEIDNSFRDESDPSLVTGWTQQCAVTAAISELGTFLRTDDDESINGLTNLLDCGPVVKKDTKTAGTDVIENPFVNIIGATTPSWIQDRLKARVGGWGLSSRMIMVHAEKKKQLIPRPSKAIKDHAAFDQHRANLLVDLETISRLVGAIQYSPAADALADSWYKDVQNRAEAYLRSPEYDNWVGYFLARKHVHTYKLAMIFSVARRDSLVIQEQDLLDSINHVEAVERDIELIFKPAVSPNSAALAEQGILDRLIAECKSIGRIERILALTRVSRFVDSTTATRIIDNAIHRRIFNQIVGIGGTVWLELPMTSKSANGPSC